MKQYHDCMAVREEFSAYLDGELAGEEREGFEAHLAECAECLRELDAMKRVDDKYRALPAVSAPEGFEAGVREAVRSGRMSLEPVRRPVPRWAGPLVAMASAAAVLIIGVVVLEIRQENPQLQMADAPALDLESADAAPLFQTSPATAVASPQAASVPDQGPAGGGATWDNFARAPEPERLMEQSEAKAEGAWESFTREPAPAADAAVAAGREDNDGALAAGLAAGVSAEEADAESRARAELMGDVPEAAPASPPPAEKLTDGADLQADALRSDRGPVVDSAVGDVVSRRVLRSFKVRADGAWVESGYAGEPTVELTRGSASLNGVMQQHRSEDWDAMLDRTALQIFQLGSVWYALEGKPAEE